MKTKYYTAEDKYCGHYHQIPAVSAAEESIFQTVMSLCRDDPQGLNSKETVSCLFCGKRDSNKCDLEVCNDTNRNVVALDRRRAVFYVQTNESLCTVGQGESPD